MARSQVDTTRTLEGSEKDRKVGFITRLFSDGSREYDFLLKILSLGRDAFWRRTAINRADVRCGDMVLDIACGTGLLTYSFARKGVLVIGVDVTREMILKSMELPEFQLYDVEFVQARAENLPLRTGVFDAATISLAMRNVSSQTETLAEMGRCVKQGHKVLSLDFAKPKSGVFRPFYYFYIFRVLPALGLTISRHWNLIFTYLANSIDLSRDPEDIQKTMETAGLSETSSEKMTHGVVALVSGVKHQEIYPR